MKEIKTSFDGSFKVTGYQELWSSAETREYGVESVVVEEEKLERSLDYLDPRGFIVLKDPDITGFSPFLQDLYRSRILLCENVLVQIHKRKDSNGGAVLIVPKLMISMKSNYESNLRNLASKLNLPIAP